MQGLHKERENSGAVPCAIQIVKFIFGVSCVFVDHIYFKQHVCRFMLFQIVQVLNFIFLNNVIAE